MAPRAAHLNTAPPTIVQSIRTRWCKCARHIQGAKLRASVPPILPLPEPPAAADHAGLWVHEVHVEHVKALAVRQQVRAYDTVAHDFGIVSVQLEQSKLIVRLKGRPRCTLKPGERAVVEVSFREEEVVHGWRHDYFNHVLFRVSHGVGWNAHVFYCEPDHRVRVLDHFY